MPVYEYEHVDPDEFMFCPMRFAVIQGIDDEPLEYCPSCGLPCRKVVSQASFKTRTEMTPAEAAKKGFTTWKRAKKGEWEKVDGPGVDAIVASDEEVESVEKEKKGIGKLDLDEGST